MKNKPNQIHTVIKNVSKREAAQMLGVCIRTIENLIHDRKIDFVRIGRRVLIPYAAIECFNEAHTIMACQPNSEALFQ